MPAASSTIRPFAKTLTRDIYSYGLLTWFCLFPAMPFGSDEAATESEISYWKLHVDSSLPLRENVLAKAPNLVSRTVFHVGTFSHWHLKLITSQTHDQTYETLKEDADPHDLLWFQIWMAMIEMLKKEPNTRNIALGEMHRVFKTPSR